MPPLQIAILGCGSRGRTYAGIVASFGNRYRITAATDSVALRCDAIAKLVPSHEIRTFSSADDLFAAGRIISIRASEGVEPFHQAHSFVRGHWSKAVDSTPMIVAKCSHDTDLLCWLAGSAPASISSFGGLEWFHRANAPSGAPSRCTDGCPAAPQCPYDAHRYLGDKRRWLAMVMDGSEAADDAAVLDFLRSSPWGRGVYQCDNDAVDHQVVATEMLNGVSATLTMTAFDHGRTLEIHGTRASLRGGSPFQEAGVPEMWLRDHETGKSEPVEIVKTGSPDTAGYAGHGGGDWGLMDALDRMFRGPDRLPPGLDGLASHRLAFLAEKSRLTQALERSPQ